MENRSARSSLSPARSSTSLSDLTPRKAMMRFAMLALVAGLALPLSACGFRPLYAENQNSTGVTNELGNIEVKGPESRVGRAIKYDLVDVLAAGHEVGSSAAYRLEFAPSVYEEDIAIQQDADVTRKNLVVVVPFKLIDTASDKLIFKSVSRSRTSYNRVSSEFANITASQDSEKRVSQAIADDMKQQLGIFFDRRLSGESLPVK